MNTISLVSFFVATISVAFFTYYIVSKMKKSNSATEEYFTGGRALAWPVVAGSLLLTNLSTEQLVGLNGDVFGDKALVGIAWEALAAFAMIATALLFLPTYLASGFTTTPAFLEKRFDKMTRSMVSGLFLFGYVTVLLPVVLYTGSLALITMFDINISIWVVAAAIGLLGSSYAIFGGLKSLKLNDFKELYTQERMFINLQYGDTFDEVNQFRESGKNIYNFDNVDLFNDFDKEK